MAMLLLLAALFLGMDAADKLATRNPMPVAWFEAGITALLVVGAVVVFVLRKDEEA